MTNPANTSQPSTSAASQIPDANRFFVKTQKFVVPCAQCDCLGLICAKNTRMRGNLEKCEGCRVKRVNCRMKDKSTAEKDHPIMKRAVFANYQPGVVRELAKFYEETEASTLGSDCPSGKCLYFYSLFSLL